MPNWYHNTLTVRGKPQEIAAFKLKAAQNVHNEEPGPINFHNFVPVPNALLNYGGAERTAGDFIISPSRQLSAEEQNAQAAKEARIEWERENWGCKWGAIRSELEPSEDDTKAVFHFDTAWGPPMRFLMKVAQLNTELLFILYSYSAEDCRWFDVAFWSDYCHVKDRTWLAEAQRMCTCGAFNNKK